jgi:hypothetical protein
MDLFRLFINSSFPMPMPMTFHPPGSNTHWPIFLHSRHPLPLLAFKVGPYLCCPISPFEQLSVPNTYGATQVLSTTPSLQKKKRCAGGMIGGQECPYSSNYTFLDSTDQVESKNTCLDFLACLNKKFEIFEVMHLEHPPIYPTICSYVYP